MPIRRVDRQLYVGDEGRLIHMTGILANQPYYIPFDDAAALDRRRVWWSRASLLVFFVTLEGAVAGRWSGWWCLAGLAALVAAPAIVTRWVRERYEAVSNPTVKRDLRRAALANAPPLGAALLTLILTVPHTLSLFARYRSWFIISLGTGVLALQLVQTVRMKRERDELGEDYVPPPAGITR